MKTLKKRMQVVGAWRCEESDELCSFGEIITTNKETPQ